MNAPLPNDVMIYDQVEPELKSYLARAIGRALDELADEALNVLGQTKLVTPPADDPEGIDLHIRLVLEMADMLVRDLTGDRA